MDTRWGGDGGSLVYFRTLAAPTGLQAICAVADHCHTCSAQPFTPDGMCDGRNFGYRPDAQIVFCDGDVPCTDPTSPPPYSCQLHRAGEVLGVCGLAVCGSGSISSGGRLWGLYDSPETTRVTSIGIEPCVRWDDAQTPVANNFELMMVVFHEVGHAAFWRNERSYADSWFTRIVSENPGKLDTPGQVVRIEDIVRGCPLIFGATFGGNPIAGVDADGRASCEGSPEDDDPDDSYYCDRTLRETCALADGVRHCHHRDATGNPVAQGGNAIDWFQGLVGRLTVLLGRSGSFREHVNISRAGFTQQTRVSSTSDSLYRYMTDAAFTLQYAAEIYRSYDPVVKQGRRGVHLDLLDDRSSTPGRGEARLAFGSAGTVMRGRLDHVWDRDWFVLRTSAGVREGRYRIRVVPDAPTSTDTVLDVWEYRPADGGWARIARNDGALADELELTVTGPPEEKVLFVRVAVPRTASIDGLLRPYAYGAGVGAYRLSVQPVLDDHPDPARDSASPLAAHRGRAPGTVAFADRDGFVLDVPRGRTVEVTVQTPGRTSGGRVFFRRAGETTETEVPRTPVVWTRWGRIGGDSFVSRLSAGALAPTTYFVTVDGAGLAAGVEMAYLISTTALAPWLGYTCPERWVETRADPSCRIAGLGPGTAAYRAGTLLNALDENFYWLQVGADEVIHITAVSGLGAPADAVSLTLHAEGVNGLPCLDGTVAMPDGRLQWRSAAIGEGAAVADAGRVNATELTFVAPAEYVTPPGTRGWYRIRVAPVLGVAAYPEPYTLIVHRNPEDDAFPELQ
ncbi:MAG: hypothetical protein QME96_06085 [Myxococcota bacterium]|nr:hypothetical protein [Myxococcota bacterium]